MVKPSLYCVLAVRPPLCDRPSVSQDSSHRPVCVVTRAYTLSSVALTWKDGLASSQGPSADQPDNATEPGGFWDRAVELRSPREHEGACQPTRGEQRRERRGIDAKNTVLLNYESQARCSSHALQPNTQRNRERGEDPAQETWRDRESQLVHPDGVHTEKVQRQRLDVTQECPAVLLWPLSRCVRRAAACPSTGLAVAVLMRGCMLGDAVAMLSQAALTQARCAQHVLRSVSTETWPATVAVV
ncbi:hypothetical protein AOLI_G00284990 [Acnodon oligacanthus]